VLFRSGENLRPSERLGGVSALMDQGDAIRIRPEIEFLEVN